MQYHLHAELMALVSTCCFFSLQTIQKRQASKEMDQSCQNHQQSRAPQNTVPMGTFRQGSVPALERGIISGDNVQFGRLRRHTRLSQSESSGAEEEWLSSSVEASGSYGQSPVLQGLQAEAVWYNRNIHDQVESGGLLSSSPRSPNTRGFLLYHSRPNQSHLQGQGPSVTTVKASGTPHRQIGKGRNRTSSETEQGGKGSRGPHPRKRGISETESKPKRDKYDTSVME